MAKDAYQTALDKASEAFNKEKKVVEPKEEIKETSVEHTEDVHSNTEEIKETVEESTVADTTSDTKPEIQEDQVWKFLSEMLGKEVKTKDDLVIKEEVITEKEREYLSEFSEKYDKYYKDTKKTPEDFLKLQRDVKQMSEEDVVKESLAMENPNLTKAEINRLFNRKFEINEDDMSEDEIEDAKLDLRIAYNKGLKLIEADKEKYLVPNKDSITSIEEQSKQRQLEAEEAAKQWSDSIAKSNAELKGVEITLGDGEKISLPIPDEAKKGVREIAQDGSMSKWLQRYQGKDGSFDQIGLQRDIFIRDNIDYVIAKAVDHKVSKILEEKVKQEKNINFKGGQKTIPVGNISKAAQEELDYLKARYNKR